MPGPTPSTPNLQWAREAGNAPPPQPPPTPSPETPPLDPSHPPATDSPPLGLSIRCPGGRSGPRGDSFGSVCGRRGRRGSGWGELLLLLYWWVSSSWWIGGCFRIFKMGVVIFAGKTEWFSIARCDLFRYGLLNCYAYANGQGNLWKHCVFVVFIEYVFAWFCDLKMSSRWIRCCNLNMRLCKLGRLRVGFCDESWIV